MANTYLDLKNRIIRETQRDDLSDTLADSLTQAIADAIDYHASTRFWFNEYKISANATPNNDTISLPAGTSFRVLDRVAVTVGGKQYELMPQELATIEDWSQAVQSIGQPSDYCVYGVGDIPVYRMWPTPNFAYSITWLGVRDLAALVNDSDTNSWCTVAQNLVVARSKYLLYRDQFRDSDGAQFAAIAEKEALGSLLADTKNRLSTGRLRSSWD